MPPLRLQHCIVAAMAFLAFMLIGGAINLSVRLAQLLPFHDPLPFLAWAIVWYVGLVALTYVVDWVGG